MEFVTDPSKVQPPNFNHQPLKRQANDWLRIV
jgi:hypothetical protein